MTKSGITLQFNLGVDTADYDRQRRGVCARTEIVTSSLTRRQHRGPERDEQLPLLSL